MKTFKDKLATFAGKLAASKFLQVMQASFLMLTPLLMIGSLFTLFSGLPFAGYQAFLESSGLKAVLNLPYTYTYGYFSLYLSFAIAFQYCRKSGMKKQAVQIGIFAIVSYLLLCPSDNVAGWVGMTGMFAAIICGFLTPYIYKIAHDHHWEITMPDSVPSAVSAAFNALIPGFLVLLVMTVINYIFSRTALGSAQNAIYSVVRLPLAFASNNMASEVIISLYCSLLWFFGIHGGAAVAPIDQMIFMGNKAANLAAYQAGKPLPYMFVGLSGGIGACTWAVLIAVLIASKKESTRSVAKVAFVPAIFNIAEPGLFGIPLILNPVFFIPFVFSGPLFNIVMHVLQFVGFLPYSNGVEVNYMIPAPIKSFINYGWQGLVTCLLFTAIQIIIYIPFIKANDKALTIEENENSKK